ncbi:hypothetical protein RF11_16488 [Thelohanellus kitauei]|uniref:Uncharacterized protein n=1 Tax=Thelohanellus kitauei TaxID=669202 RepID=A0A0C2JUT0_THEKT|nr:hypothetical protein RF11_16488 [Thelohanellus kitauei]
MCGRKIKQNNEVQEKHTMVSDFELYMSMTLSFAFIVIYDVTFTFSLLIDAPYVNQRIEYFRDVFEHYVNNYIAHENFKHDFRKNPAGDDIVIDLGARFEMDTRSIAVIWCLK